VRDGRIFECFGVGIAHDEVYAFNTLTIHVGHGITTTATYTDDLDVGRECWCCRRQFYFERRAAEVF